ncbi:PAX transactivation activation domain-interacting protein [Aphelenchoides besseyi]|nr:PAX transactivation activation domain-interacting protein [Aphelenchoides besseyi]
MDQPLSPLEPLDPHRLRDMVVDKQTPQSTASSTIGHQMPHQWTSQTANQTASPASVGSPHSIVNQRSSTGSVEMNSPFQTARPPSQQQQPNSTTHNYDFNTPRTSMYQSGSSPTKPLVQQHMMSPHSNHPPASPFNRSTSAASNNPSSSPYPQVPPQYPGVSSPMYPPASAYPVRLPPSYPAPTGQNPQQVSSQYVSYPNGPQQWPPQNVLPQYPNQSAGQRMLATGQRPMITRVPYVQQGYPTGMPPPNTMYPPRTPRQPVVQYPRTATVPSTPQTPATSSTTPTNGGTQFAGQYPQPHYYIPQQQRLQQQRQPSPIRSPFVAQQPTVVHPGTPQPQAPSTPMTHPNTPGGSGDRTKMAVRFGAQQQSSGPQTPCPSTPSSQPQDHGPQTPGTPLQQQQRLAHASSTGIQNSTPHAAQVPIMRSPPLVGPAQAAQMPAVGQHHALIRPQAPLPQQPIHPQQQSVDIARRMMHHSTTPGTLIAGQRNGAPIYAQHPASAVQQQRIATVQPIGIHPANAMMQRIPGVQPATRMRPPQYYGQFFNGQQQTNPETFLAGCCFVIEDISLQGYDKHELESRLRYYGAEVEHNLNAIHEPPQVPFYGAPIPTSRVTHILCDTLTMKIRQQVLRFTLPQRLVTSHWLSWCLEKRKLEPPTRACHLPTPWAEDKLPGTDKLLTAEGFNESELACIRVMCKAIGARFTNYMTKKHAALISKTGEGPKAEKTREWKIPILNYGWLMRLYFGNIQMINEINRDIHKPPGDPQFQVDSTPYVLERISEFPLKLLIPWRAPIVVTEEAIRLATQTREKIAEDFSIFPHKKLLMDPLPAPTDDQIEAATRILMENSRIPNVRIFIDGLPQSLKETLMRKVRFMGGQEADSIIACTHFVTTNLKRTPTLLEALARGKEVVDPAWINHSFSRVHFVDSFDFHVRDAENERKFRFSALNTIYRARERAIFEDMTIHLSPSVLPSYEVLRNLIEAGGGVVEKEKPKFKKIAECIRYDKTFLIVVNDADAISYGHFYAKRIPLFNEEFILMSILRHRVDTGPTYRLNPPLVDTSRPSPAKFVRTPQQRPADRIKLAA